MPASQKIKPRTRDPIARRIADYVNTHFDGNLSQASVALPCQYDALRVSALGLGTRLNLSLLIVLSKHSGRSLDWWVTGKEAEPEDEL